MILTLNPGKMIIVFLKVLMWIAIGFTVVSGILFFPANANENKQIGTRNIRILEKIDTGNYCRFKVEDIETGNKFTITPTQEWYDSMEVGDLSTARVSLNDTRGFLMFWLFFSSVISVAAAVLLFIWFLTEIPGMIRSVNKEVVLDLRSKKTKQRELTLKELEKTPEFKAWKKDYIKALNTDIREL